MLRRQSRNEIEMPAHVVIEHRQISAGHVGNGDLIAVHRELVKDSPHRDDIVVWVGGEADDAGVSGQLGSAPNLGAECVEDLPVERARGAVVRYQGGQAML